MKSTSGHGPTSIPEHSEAAAELAATDKAIEVRLNGHLLPVPTEDSASRYTHEKHGYSTTKLISIEPNLLKDNNKIEISFPDGKPATIGSTVIRASRPS